MPPGPSGLRTEDHAIEAERLDALRRYAILDTPVEAGFEDIVLLATQVCKAPVALVTLVDGDRQWFKARIGFDAAETPLDQSICRHALGRPGVLVIPDLGADERTRDNPLVAGGPRLRFYAGARLDTPEGQAIGTLCVIDHAPRPEGLTGVEAGALEALARQVMTQMELRHVAAARDAALRELRAGDARRRQILDGAIEHAIVALDRDGRVTEWNAGAERVFGWSAREMRGGTIERLHTPEDAADGFPGRDMRRALDHGLGGGERWHLRKGGGRFWAIGEMVPLKDDEGRPIGFLKIARDETERRATLERQRGEQEFMRSVLASSDDCIKVLDLDGILTFMSEGGRRVMEVSDFNAIRGCSWPDFWHGEKNAEALAAIAAARAGGVGHFQGRAETMAGTSKWWDVRVTPILDADGRPEKLLSISRDITAAWRAEGALREARDLNTLILASSTDCIVVLDLEGRTRFVSPGGVASMEVSDVEAIIGLSWLRVWTGADHAAAVAALAAARAGGTGRFQGFCPTHKGTPKWWDVAVSALRGPNGEPERLVSIGRDITATKEAERKLLQSQERLSLALDASDMVGIWDWHVRTDLIHADANFARIYGVDPAWAARGAPFADYAARIHPDDRPGVEAALDRVFAGLGEFSHEYRISGPDGAARWVLARGRVVRDADGAAMRFPGALVDITGRKRAEARRDALLNLGDRLRDMEDPAEMAVAAAAIMGGTLDANRAGYGTVDEPQEVLSIDRDWNAPGVRSIAGTHAFRGYGSFIDDLKQGATVVIDDVARDSRTAPHTEALAALGIRSIVNIPVFEHGRLVALFYIHGATVRRWEAEQVSFVRDVADRTRAATARRHAERRLLALNDDLERRVEERTRALTRSEVRLQAYFNASPEYLSVVRLRDDGRLVYDDLNLACEALFGRTREDVIGRTPEEVLNPQSADSVNLYARECLRTGRTLNYEVERAFGAERSIVVNVVVAPIALPRDERALVLFCGRDLTDQRQTENALRQSQKMEAVGQLTGGVAHDFNNLLTVIRSSVDLLKRPDLAEDRRRRYIEAISDTATRAAKLTGQLLAFARRQALKPETFDAASSVKALSDMIVTITGSRIKIETRSPDGPCLINADPSQFDTALVNLAVNARDAMGGEGRLTIAVRTASAIPRRRRHDMKAGAFVAISVTDTGCGIDPADIEKIFEPFFTTKEVGKGTGLGLSQVIGFVKQSGGDVTVESTPGEGSTFSLYMPRAEGGPTAGARGAGSERPVDGRGTCVLVVEDNEAVGRFAVQTLGELGYVAVLAADADAALRELAQDPGRFHVVFSDVVMPGMNGVELAREIGRRHADLPVVLTSGYSHVLAENGAHGFELLHKPYSIEQLSRVLQDAAGWRIRRATAP